MRTIRIGSGAGYSGDRIEPALELAEKGGIQYLVFECLGERTVALAQQARMKNPDGGFDPLLEERMRAVLPACAGGIKIVTNMGAANPLAAARKTAEIARSLGLSSLKIAAVTGDDVAVRIGNEVETLYTNGPAAGGGAFKSARDVVAVASVLLPRELAKPSIQFVGA